MEGFAGLRCLNTGGHCILLNQCECIFLLGFKSMWMACKVFSFFDVGAKHRYHKLYSSERVSRGLYNWGNTYKG